MQTDPCKMAARLEKLEKVYEAAIEFRYALRCKSINTCQAKLDELDKAFTEAEQ